MNARELAAWLIANGGDLPVCAKVVSHAATMPTEVASVDLMFNKRYVCVVSDAVVAMGDVVVLLVDTGVK